MNPDINFLGNIIAAGMAHYWESGTNCYAYYELFFNRLLTVLYRGIWNCTRGILDSVKKTASYHFEQGFTSNLGKIEEVSIDPQLGEDLTYTTFPEKKGKSSKKQRVSKKD